MSEFITIELPDEIYHRLQQIARESNREVGEILTDTVNRIVLERPTGDEMILPSKLSPPRSIGTGSSGMEDLASRCEELLWNKE